MSLFHEHVRNSVPELLAWEESQEQAWSPMEPTLPQLLAPRLSNGSFKNVTTSQVFTQELESGEVQTPHICLNTVTAASFRDVSSDGVLGIGSCS